MSRGQSAGRAAFARSVRASVPAALLMLLGLAFLLVGEAMEQTTVATVGKWLFIPGLVLFGFFSLRAFKGATDRLRSGR